MSEEELLAQAIALSMEENAEVPIIAVDVPVNADHNAMPVAPAGDSSGDAPLPIEGSGVESNQPPPPAIVEGLASESLLASEPIALAEDDEDLLAQALAMSMQADSVSADMAATAPPVVVPALTSRWSCEICTFSNSASHRVCEMCGTDRPSGSGVSAAAAAVVTPSASLPWSCSICTFVNPHSSRQCSMCSSPSPHMVSAVNSTGPPKSATAAVSKSVVAAQPAEVARPTATLKPSSVKPSPVPLKTLHLRSSLLRTLCGWLTHPDVWPSLLSSGDDSSSDSETEMALVRLMKLASVPTRLDEYANLDQLSAQLERLGELAVDYRNGIIPDIIRYQNQTEVPELPHVCVFIINLNSN